MWAALGPCRCFSFQLSCLVITLGSVYRNINPTGGKTALFTYFGHSQHLWSLASSLYNFTFLAHLSFLSLISFLPSHNPFNHILSLFFSLQVILQFFFFSIILTHFLSLRPNITYVTSRISLYDYVTWYLYFHL